VSELDGTARIRVVVGHGTKECGGICNWRKSEFQRKRRKALCHVMLFLLRVELILVR
jgi:hypothetical protein